MLRTYVRYTNNGHTVEVYVIRKSSVVHTLTMTYRNAYLATSYTRSCRRTARKQARKMGLT